MKSPRDILLQRHAEAEAELDRLRRGVIASHLPEGDEARAKGAGEWHTGLVRALFSLRWHVTGLAAAWVVIAVLNHDNASPTAPTYATLSKSSVEQLVLAIKENRRLFGELFEPTAESPKVQPLSVPRRSERQSPVYITYQHYYEHNKPFCNRSAQPGGAVSQVAC